MIINLITVDKPTLTEMGGCPIDGIFGVTNRGQFVMHTFNNFEPDRKS